jgi:hypothetical protein
MRPKSEQNCVPAKHLILMNRCQEKVILFVLYFIGRTVFPVPQFVYTKGTAGEPADWWYWLNDLY